jgi:nicotinate phosphoribosyltransferase
MAGSEASPGDDDTPEEAARPHSSTPDEIEQGLVAEAHLATTRDILFAHGTDPSVTAEVRIGDLPLRWPWAVLCGVEEAISLLEGREVDVTAVPEGSIVYPEEPVLQVSGRYLSFAGLETAVAGMLGQATAVATAAARLKLAVGGKPVRPIGLGRLHPAVVPVVEWAAYVGGCDEVATAVGAAITSSKGASPVGAELSLILGEPEAWEAFDEDVEDTVPRVVTAGVLEDERSTALAAVDALGDHLAGVYLEAPSESPEKLVHVAREVRWELDARGRSDVRVTVAGDLDEHTLRRLARHADGFGVGYPLVGPPAVPVSFDIVEVEGEPRARRGTLSGRKTLWRCEACGNRGIAPARAQHEPCPRCEGRLRSLLVPRLASGVRDEGAPDAAAVRARALKEAAEAPPPFSS